jgi:hypothetical protein
MGFLAMRILACVTAWKTVPLRLRQAAPDLRIGKP